MSKKITKRQKELLSDLGLHVPTTKRAARKMTRFITEGNGTQGDTELDRVRIAKAYEEQWIGRRCRYPRHGIVEVVRLVPLEGEQVKQLSGRNRDPFAALVKIGDSDVTDLCRLSALY